ncbi:MAG: helix-turn-helix domain-containing protein [Xanthobacteraceae bacterium]|nr:helix-turn-helix domain-containing protein [Xanthobacteraceae bacterium]
MPEDATSAFDNTEHLMDVGRDVAAVIQALAILRAIGAQHKGATLSVIAKAAGVSRSTTLNIIRTLVNQRIVSFSRDTKVYRLGIGLLELSRPLLNRSEFELIEPDLYQIATRFETTASIWLVLNNGRLLLLGRIAPDSYIRIEFRIATRLPLYAGATGLVVAAAHQAPDDEIIDAMARIRWAVPPTPEAYLAEAKRARARGYAVDIGHLIRGVTSVAAAVCDRSGRARLVVGVHAFQGQLVGNEITKLGRELHALATRSGAALYQTSATAPVEEPAQQTRHDPSPTARKTHVGSRPLRQKGIA